MMQQRDGIPWHSLSGDAVLDRMQSNIATGIDDAEAASRLQKLGKNILLSTQTTSPLKILLNQFKSILVITLIVAALIAMFVGEAADTIAILAIVILNAALGFKQQMRAERAIEALKRHSTTFTTVKRNNQYTRLSQEFLVPGDIISIHAGDMIPADTRLLSTSEFKVDESLLTGESMPVAKDATVILEETQPPSDRSNMTLKGTLCVKGSATGVVVETGMRSELGRIAGLLQTEPPTITPLQRRLEEFSRHMSIAVVAICLFIFLSGILRGENFTLMMITAISLAVAAIPEALPAVVTGSLALGARVMAQKNSLIRHLPAVEALGSVTCIATDKTGTLTQNKMQVAAFYLPDSDNLIDFQNSLHPESKGKINPEELAKPKFIRLMHMMALNHDLRPIDNHNDNHNITLDVSSKPDRASEWSGDPTESALVKFASLHGYDSLEMQGKMPRLATLAFTSERALMTTAHFEANPKSEKLGRSKNNIIYFTKGAPEKILSLCTRLSRNKREEIENIVASMTANGMRVLGFGWKIEDVKTDLNENSIMSNPFKLSSNSESDLHFAGIVGLIDPPKLAAKSAVQASIAAGIKVIMITGDHPETARIIAKQVGILPTKTGPNQCTTSDSVTTGPFLDTLNDDELKNQCKDTLVFARVQPEHKIRIVKALQSRGEIVAMTGDGINDAPALRRADVGVSMGFGGTDVAREASDIILLDDNLSTIVDAIAEGRRIYENIRRFVKFALSGNSGELWTLFLAPFVGLPTPLLPIQILWINLVTDGLPGLALAVGPASQDIMNSPPRNPKESIFGAGLWQHCVWAGLLIAGLTLGSMGVCWYSGSPNWQTMAFTVLTFTQLTHVFSISRGRSPISSENLRQNPRLSIALFATFVIHITIIYVPFANEIFKTTPLTVWELFHAMAASLIILMSVETEKRFSARRSQTKKQDWNIRNPRV